MKKLHELWCDGEKILIIANLSEPSSEDHRNFCAEFFAQTAIEFPEDW